MKSFKGISNISELVKSTEDKLAEDKLAEDNINKESCNDLGNVAKNHIKGDKKQKKSYDDIRKSVATDLLLNSKRVKFTQSIRESMEKIDSTTYMIKTADVEIEWKIEMRDGVPWLRRVTKPQDIVENNNDNRNI